jgi:hypothetical protein
MSAEQGPGSALPAYSSRLLILLIGIAVLSPHAPAVPDRPGRGEPAKTQVVVKVPDNFESFQNQHLEVVLYEYDPRVKGRETLVDKHSDKAFSHNRFAETTIAISLGANAQMKPAMHYYVTVEAYNAAGKRTLIGEKECKRGISNVLSEGKANQVTMIVRQARVQDIVMDIADEFKKGNDAKAAEMVQARAKEFEGVDDLMGLYRQRTRGGLGWGSTSGNNSAKDGIEIKVRNLARAVPANFFQDAKNNEEAAYWIAAIAELTAARDAEFRPMGKKTKADWHKKAGQLRTEADAFAMAVAAKNVLAIQSSAQGITNACNQCHAVYRD